MLTSYLRNVQVTLGILAALTEKSQTDAALIAPTVLKILEMILREFIKQLDSLSWHLVNILTLR